MALTLRNLAGPELRDGRNYNGGAALPTNMIVTGIAPLPPDGGRYWFEGNGPSITPFPALAQVGGSLTQPLQWIGLAAWVLVTAPAGADEFGIIRWTTAAGTDARVLVAVWDGSRYKLSFRTNAGVEVARSISSFTIGQNVSILVEFEAGLVRVFANGVIEMQWLAGPPSSGAVDIYPTKVAAGNHRRRWRGMTRWEGMTVDDRPDPEVEVRAIFPHTNTADNDFGDMTSPSNGLASVNYWWDFDPAVSGIANDDTNFNACPAALDLEQLSGLTAVAAPFTKTIRGVMHRGRARNTTSTKVWPGLAAMRYNGTLYFHALDVSSANVYGPELALWTDPPDGSYPWNLPTIDAAGAATMRSGGGGVAIERRWTAIGWEVVAGEAFGTVEVRRVRSRKRPKNRRSRLPDHLTVTREDLARAGFLGFTEEEQARQDLDEEFAVLRYIYGF